MRTRRFASFGGRIAFFIVSYLLLQVVLAKTGEVGCVLGEETGGKERHAYAGDWGERPRKEEMRQGQLIDDSSKRRLGATTGSPESASRSAGASTSARSS